jgi:hypothetical protein
MYLERRGCGAIMVALGREMTPHSPHCSAGGWGMQGGWLGFQNDTTAEMEVAALAYLPLSRVALRARAVRFLTNKKFTLCVSELKRESWMSAATPSPPSAKAACIGRA